MICWHLLQYSLKKNVMNIILLKPEEIAKSINKTVLLDDHRAEHVVKVLRSSEGESLRVGVIDGCKGSAVVKKIKKKYPFLVELVVDLEDEQLEQMPEIDLVLALPRPIMLRRILSQATALGIGQFFLINANRVEKSFWQANLLEEKEYLPHLVAGLEQAVATRLPKVSFFKRFRPFVEDYLPTIKEKYDHLIVGDPTGDQSLQEAIVYSKSNKTELNRVLLCIGPEGGWVDFELEKFKAQDFSICTIGERILKVDTAVVALHSKVSTLLEMRSHSV